MVDKLPVLQLVQPLGEPVNESRQDRPTLIVVDSHIAWGAPTKQAQISLNKNGVFCGERVLQKF